MQQQTQPSFLMDDKKWAKNGFGEPISTRGKGEGKFSREESEMVRKAVMEYCSLKSIDVNRLCSECEHKPELRGAWMEISKALPQRSVQSVYRHGLRLLHPFRRGAWQQEEIDRLFELVTRFGRKWVQIQRILNRSADACRDKYRECANVTTKGRWREDEIQQLEQIIRDYLKDKVDPKDTMIEIGKKIEANNISVPWELLSQKMGTRSRLSCFKKFQKLCGLFVYPDGTSEERPRKRRKTTKEEQEEEEAAAAGGGANDNNDDDDDGLGDITGDPDVYLLNELIQTGAQVASEVPWETLRIDNAHQRWNMLKEELLQEEGDDEETEEALALLPLAELAQLLLDRRNSQAKNAVETLEAVDLPIV